jgi:DNA ligase-1
VPFQNISQRIKRKYDIDKMAKELPVEVNVFDILYLDGESLMHHQFEQRSKTLHKIIKADKWKIVPAKQLITGSEKEAQRFYEQALKENQEGIMMKALNAEYKPGSRVGYMLKIKPEENDLDLAIVGGEYGTGKRAGWISSYILACKEKDKFLTIGKVGTGFKEKDEHDKHGISFEELTKKLKPYIIEEKGREVTINPKIVITVTYQEIQASPSYTSGFALRFPRFKLIRPDKSPNDIATLEEIRKEYKKQIKR